jgi:hypothetical protein
MHSLQTQRHHWLVMEGTGLQCHVSSALQHQQQQQQQQQLMLLLLLLILLLIPLSL